MKCPKCGFVEIAAGKTCRYCGSSLQQSILIPFPVAPTVEVKEESEDRQTDWRVELRERIQAIRARRGITAALQEAAVDQPAVPPKPEDQAKPANPIVEAALNRIRRTGGFEVKESLTQPPQGVKDELKLKIGHSPVIASPLPDVSGHQQESSIRTDIQGTNALAPEPMTYVATKRGDNSVSRGGRPSIPPQPVNLPASAWNGRTNQEQEVSSDAVSLETTSTDLDPLADAAEVADPPDMAYQETSLPQSQQSTEFKLQTASVSQRVRSGVVDVLVMVLVNVPFVALVEMSSGFADRRVQLVLGCIAAILYLFYTTLMLVTAGQTVGMMAAGIVAVDARSLNLPTISQALRRAVGPLLAAAPGLLGFLFPVLDAQRRSLSDIISGTSVKRAFDEVADAYVPWLYHHVRS